MRTLSKFETMSNLRLRLVMTYTRKPGVYITVGRESTEKDENFRGSFWVLARGVTRQDGWNLLMEKETTEGEARVLRNDIRRWLFHFGPSSNISFLILKVGFSDLDRYVYRLCDVEKALQPSRLDFVFLDFGVNFLDLIGILAKF